MVQTVAADQKCILAQNHSVLYKPTAGYWNLFFDRQEASVKIWEPEWCDIIFWFLLGLEQQCSESAAAVWSNLDVLWSTTISMSPLTPYQTFVSSYSVSWTFANPLLFIAFLRIESSWMWARAQTVACPWVATQTFHRPSDVNIRLHISINCSRVHINFPNMLAKE